MSTEPEAEPAEEHGRLARILLSIELRWTIRFTFVMMVMVLVLGAIQYQRLEERMLAEAQRIMEAQAKAIEAAVESEPWQEDGQQALIDRIDQQVASAGPELELGIRFLDEEGRLLIERGSFRQIDIPIYPPGELFDPGSLLRVVNVGKPHYFVVLQRPFDRGWIEVAIYNRRFIEGIHFIRNNFLLSAPFALLLTALLAWGLARSMLVPISKITESARRITASQLNERIPLTGSGDELDRLAETLNEMMERIAAGVARIRSFSSNAAHQLRTPVSRLRVRLERARDAERNAALDQAFIESALEDIERVSEVIAGMLRLAESESGLSSDQRERIDVSALLEGVGEFFEPIASEQEITIETGGEPDLWIEGDPNWLTELFSNLVDNAIKFTPGGGRIRILWRRDGECARVEVVDTGCGFSLKEGDTAYTNVRRAPVSGGPQGLGLGLPLAFEIVRAHGGEISIERVSATGDSSESGTRASVRIPLSNAPISP